MSISPQSHRAGVDAALSINNYNVSLPKEGCACVVAYCTVHRSRCKRLLRSCGVLDGPTDSIKNCNASSPKEGCAHVVACCTVRRSWRRWLLRSCGVSDGPIDFANNCNASLLREGCARIVAYCTVHHSRCKQLFCSCGISDGLTDSVCCLACRSLYKWLWRSHANFDASWLNFAGTLICGTWFSKESVCSSFCWAFGCCRRATKAAKALPCCAMSARIRSCMSLGIMENICWVCCWYWYQNLGGGFSCTLVCSIFPRSILTGVITTTWVASIAMRFSFLRRRRKLLL